MLDFSTSPIIGCVHLQATIGSPYYQGDPNEVIAHALVDARRLIEGGVDALIVENFGDRPFSTGAVPLSAIATVAAVAYAVRSSYDIPVGVAVLRNESEAAMAIASAIGADFIRVNVLLGAVLAAQGIVAGKGYETLALRSALGSRVQILADAGVKHSRPFVYDDVFEEITELSKYADAVVLTGAHTGQAADGDLVRSAREAAAVPLVAGTGVTSSSLEQYVSCVDGFIVGSDFKEDGSISNPVDVHRVKKLVARRDALLAEVR